jgi:bifunctional non-homologous end joining protein LigD
MPQVGSSRISLRCCVHFQQRFPLIMVAMAKLPGRSCLIDGEAIVSNDSGLAVFNLVRSWPTTLSAVLCAFDLLELDGQDLRRLAIEDRKRTLDGLVGAPQRGIAVNKHFIGDADIVYRHACKLGCEGIVSKRLGSTYRSGRSKHWLKTKNPAGAGRKARSRGGLGMLMRPERRELGCV